MPPIPITDSGHYRPYTKTAGSEPLPGYRLISPLGRGGFGEVWKCEAPGGLHKAIKFVASEADDGRGVERFGQELAAFEQIKAIRHPFLLTLERVEQLDGELVMVMELADRQLQDRFRECQSCGLPGIPRDELLAYFADAAEALDVISAKHGLQHLDIKPANLFLVAGHVKVGDYGLVAQLEGSEARNRGLTPRYAPPEVLNGAPPSSSSDQYSLALVYAELLTGAFPYPGRTPQQLMLQHVTGQPDLSALPPCDRAALARALAKRPEDRFPSCLAFVQALLASGAETALPAAAMALRRARVDRSVAEMTPAPLAGDEDYPAGASSVSARGSPTQPDRPEARPEPTLTSKPHPTLPGGRTSTLPPLVSGSQKSGPQKPAPKGPPNPRLSTGAVKTPAPHAAVEFKAPAPPEEVVAEAGMVVLDPIRSIVPVARLLGKNARDPRLGALALATAVVEAVAAGGSAPQLAGEAARLADGSWVCQFPSTVPATVVPLKLGVVRDLWGVSIEQPDATTLVMRRAVGGGMFGGKKFGYEVTVTLPPPAKLLGEVTAVGRLFGSPDPKFAREALDTVPKVLAEVRGQLCNVPERRKHPRLACRMAATIYPVHSDGGIDAAMPVTCRDVSVGGVGFVSARSLPTRYAFIAFTGVPALAEHALLLRLMRVQPVDSGRDYGAHFRTDL